MGRTVWSEQEEEGFERTTAAAMAKKISVHKNDLLVVKEGSHRTMLGGVRNTNNCDGNTTVNKLTSSSSKNEDAAHEVQNSAMGTRTTDSARVTKFTKELSGQMVILGTIYTLLLPE
ncbi:putative transporter C5D6.04 [Gossypium arboreum]|uniref:Putative transporter C5D6.04 n=1 Tax=Gossypium arboreum TaxID=29729 RepID=A0A0B0NK05_GOSAR|nr:putative transporter C5D6.04 [Gossypium arboreum]